MGPKAGLLVASGIGDECTEGAGAVPGATAKVSSLKRPTNVPFATPVLVGLEVALIPRHPERCVGHLDHEEVEVGAVRQPGGVDLHLLDRPAIADADLRLRVGQAARGHDAR